MADANPDYLTISLTIFLRIQGVLPFDVYIERAPGKFTKLFPKNEIIDQERLKSYQLEKGVQALFVKRTDYRVYLLYVEQIANQVLGQTKQLSAMPSEQVLAVIKEMTDLTMLEIIVDMHVDEQSVSHAAQTVKGCLEVLGKDPISLIKIIGYLAKQPYLIKHSLGCSIFALLLARAMKLESQKTLISVGLGSLLHDVGMTQIGFDAEQKSELSPEEWKEVRRHPELGKRMLDAVKGVSPEVKHIILQHHEQPNGQGYPNGLHKKDIYYLAKVVSIADCFAALVAQRTYRGPFAPIEALKLLGEDRGKFDPEMLQLFASIFVKVKTK